VAIDADYQRSHRDLAALKLELKEDGVEAASKCRGEVPTFGFSVASRFLQRIVESISIVLNLALRLGVPIKGTLNQLDGIDMRSTYPLVLPTLLPGLRSRVITTGSI